MKKITQKKAVFYILYQEFRKNPLEWIPAWRFVGELHIKELDRWYLMSYKCPTNGLEIYKDNPGLIERQWTKGKSGATYYEYRIRGGVTANDIQDVELRRFYQILKQSMPVSPQAQELTKQMKMV